MDLKSTLEIQAEGYKGRKPGGIKSNNPDKILEKAKGMWGSDPDFHLEMMREMRSECPSMKGVGYAKLTATQKLNVARRMHSKAQTRVRAARLKSKSTYPSGPKN